MDTKISKSKFKSKAFEYFRQVERTGQELIITNHGKPVLKIVPYEDDPFIKFKALRNPVLKYDDPTETCGIG